MLNVPSYPLVVTPSGLFPPTMTTLNSELTIILDNAVLYVLYHLLVNAGICSSLNVRMKFNKSLTGIAQKVPCTDPCHVQESTLTFLRCSSNSCLQTDLETVCKTNCLPALECDAELPVNATFLGAQREYNCVLQSASSRRMYVMYEAGYVHLINLNHMLYYIILLLFILCIYDLQVRIFFSSSNKNVNLSLIHTQQTNVNDRICVSGFQD